MSFHLSVFSTFFFSTFPSFQLSIFLTIHRSFCWTFQLFVFPSIWLSNFFYLSDFRTTANFLWLATFINTCFAAGTLANSDYVLLWLKFLSELPSKDYFCFVFNICPTVTLYPALQPLVWSPAASRIKAFSLSKPGLQPLVYILSYQGLQPLLSRYAVSLLSRHPASLIKICSLSYHGL